MKKAVDTCRIQKALHALNQLTPQQIKKINTQQSLNQLRFKRIQNLKRRQLAATNTNQVGDVESVEDKDVNVNGRIDWNMFKKAPIVAFKQSERNYEEKFNKVIQEYRQTIHANVNNSQGQIMIEDKFLKPKIRAPKNIFTSSEVAQEPKNGQHWLKSFPDNQYNTKGLERFSQNPINHILPHSNFSTLPKEDRPTQLTSTGQKNVKQDNVQVINHKNQFLPASNSITPGWTFTQTNTGGLTNNNLFAKTIQAPEEIPPEPIKPKSGLFSQSNPLVNLTPTTNVAFHIGNVKPVIPSLFSNQTDTAKPSIFSKMITVEQPQPKPAVFDVKHGLFSKANPLASEEKKEDEKKNIFNIGSNSLFGNPKPEPPKQLFFESKKQEVKIQPKQEVKLIPAQNKVEEKPSIFSKITSNTTSNIFDKPAIHAFAAKSTQNNPNSTLFQNVTTTAPASTPFQYAKDPLKPNLFGKTEQKKQTTNYQSGSLFTNSFRTASPPKIQQKKPQPPKPVVQQKPNIFANPTSNFFSSKPQPTPSNPINLNLPVQQPQKSSLFTSKTPQPSIPSVFKTFAQFAAKPTATAFTNQLKQMTDKPSSIFGQTTTQPNKSPLFASMVERGKQKEIQSQSLKQQRAKQDKLRQQKAKQEKLKQEKLKQEKAKLDKAKEEQSNNQRSSVKKPAELFGDFAKSKPEKNMFSKESPALFGTKKEGEGIFGNSISAGNIFGGNTGGFFKANAVQQKSLFKNLPGSSAGGGLFGQTQPLFGGSKQVKQKQDDESEEGQEQNEDGVIEHKDEIDPNLSTGKYKYEESTVKYRETVPKFKRGNLNIVENVIISIEKFTGSENHTFCVRLSNKCPYFSASIIAGLTQITKITENSFRNINIKKIPFTDQNGKVSLELLKIQFKDQAQGAQFYNKFSQICKKK